MKIIVGLGNPSEKYENTRHNIGFMVVDELARKFSVFSVKYSVDRKTNALILKTKFNGNGILLVNPQTEMNASGSAVKSLLLASRLSHLASNLWVIHDDLDLPLGKLKITLGHGSAGHHGIDSLVEQLGTQDFVRFKVGIGPLGKTKTRHEVIDFVLEELSGKEAVEADKMIKKASQAVELALKRGIETAMNQYNK